MKLLAVGYLFVKIPHSNGKFIQVESCVVKNSVFKTRMALSERTSIPISKALNL